MKQITLKERVKHTTAILKEIEQDGEALLVKIGELSKHVPTDGELTTFPERMILTSVNFAWAVRMFPLFDISALTRLREFTLEDIEPSFGRNSDRDRNFSGKLYLPHFAWVNLRYASNVEYTINGELNIIQFGRVCFSWDRGLIEKNLKALKGMHIRIRANRPEIPKLVNSRIAEVVERFDSVHLIWEAEWEPTPLKDPLVVGTIGDTHFLIDQYDVTKLERYISSEFTRKVD